MEPLISVIVPVYNVEKYLRRCVRSIVKQTYRNLEIILVDDGSTDGSGKLCDELAEEDSRVFVIHQDNGGLSAARNCALDVAKGEYIAFVDSDDCIDEKMYRVLAERMVSAGADMAICGYSKWLEEQECSEYTGVTFDERVLDGDEASELLFREELSILMPVAWNKLYKKELWNELRYPIGKFHEDEHVIHYLLNRCERVAMVPESLYVYSIRAGSIMKTRALKASRDWVEALLDRMNFYERIGNEALARKQRERCIRMILWECKKIKEMDFHATEFIRDMAQTVRRLLRNGKPKGSVGAKVFARFPILYIRFSKHML